MQPQETYFSRDGVHDMFWPEPMDMAAINAHCNSTLGVVPRPDWIAEEFAGRNVTPISVALATDICFRELNLHRVEICIRPENRASLRVVEKLGFRYEGYRRRYIHIDGDWRDHYAFALVREDVPEGVLRRWASGHVPPDAATVPPEDRMPV